MQQYVVTFTATMWFFGDFDTQKRSRIFLLYVPRKQTSYTSYTTDYSWVIDVRHIIILFKPITKVRWWLPTDTHDKQGPVGKRETEVVPACVGNDNICEVWVFLVTYLAMKKTDSATTKSKPNRD